jgi:hypothetical protein
VEEPLDSIWHVITGGCVIRAVHERTVIAYLYSLMQNSALSHGLYKQPMTALSDEPASSFLYPYHKELTVSIDFPAHPLR